eukprot:PhF_6_TR37870/c0_g1_i3/m.56463
MRQLRFVQRIKLSSPRLRKFIRKQEVQNAHHHIILYASPHHTFPCDGTPTLFRKVVTSSNEEENIITFQTQNKTFYHEVFMHESNMFYQTHERVVHPPSAVQQQQHQQHRRNVKPLGYWDTVTEVITQTYEEVKTVATVTTQVMDMAATVVVGIVTGELDMDRTVTLVDNPLAFNGDLTKKVDKWDIDTEFKFAGSSHLTATIQLIMVIENYDLKTLTVYIAGTLEAAVRGEGTVTYSYTKKDKKLIAQIDLTSITFSIGALPVHIQPSVPIYIGYEVEIEATATVVVVLVGSGSIRVGLDYNPSDGKVTPTIEHDFHFTPQIEEAKVEGTATFQAYIEPSVIAKIDLIGGPTATFRITAEAILSLDTSSTTCMVNVHFDVQQLFTVAAFLEIVIGGQTILEKKEFGPWTVYTNKKTVR